MADKIRYYMEQSVPELEDLLRKNLFDKQETRKIMKKRTDFEQRITGRSARPHDFLRYAEFEANLEELRKKRLNRLRKVVLADGRKLVDTRPSVSDWAGPRRVFFIYDRAIRKFQSDSSIWNAYISYAKKTKSNKKLFQIFSQLLALQPHNEAAWVAAATFQMDEYANVAGARSVLQRALRFNPDSLLLWTEYAKLELIYVAKLLSRRKVLGLLRHSATSTAAPELPKQDKPEDATILLPEATESEPSEFFQKQLERLPDADMEILADAETNPALRGDVALAVFDIGLETLVGCYCKRHGYTSASQPTLRDSLSHRKPRQYCLEVAAAFLRVFDKFEVLDRMYLGDHVIRHLFQAFQAAEIQPPAQIFLWDVTLPLRHVKPDEKEFPDMLKMSFNKYMAHATKNKYGHKTEERKAVDSELRRAYLEVLEGYKQREGLDENLKVVVEVFEKKVEMQK